MHTIGELIERFGGAAKMAPEIGQSAATIRQWAARESIPGRYWQEIVDAARQRNVRGVTFAALAELAKRKAAA